MEKEKGKCRCLALALGARGLSVPATHQPGDSRPSPALAPQTMLISPWPAEEVSQKGEVERVTELQLKPNFH